MDTYRDMVLLNEQWASGRAPWKRWPDRQKTTPMVAKFRPKLVS